MVPCTVYATLNQLLEQNYCETTTKSAVKLAGCHHPLRSCLRKIKTEWASDSNLCAFWLSTERNLLQCGAKRLILYVPNAEGDGQSSINKYWLDEGNSSESKKSNSFHAFAKTYSILLQYNEDLHDVTSLFGNQT